ncbi:hypothetical protein JCM19235_5185 [Vibrio maritimus]|uniref:Uncharacterized protein n=1 Tax=Vibrio maritimus TaxID=990268 RepID=A0A090RN13_9VIBR|nr:hypothetical protein JCM19235_5185 [Vibrio maritimus]
MGPDILNQTVEFLDTFYIDWLSVVFAINNDLHCVLTNILLNQYIDLSFSFTIDSVKHDIMLNRASGIIAFESSPPSTQVVSNQDYYPSYFLSFRDPNLIVNLTLLIQLLADFHTPIMQLFQS